MSPRGRRPAGSPDAREAIIVAARAAFARDGYRTSLRGIARAAGVDPALVHHYFADRAELFSQAVLGGIAVLGIDPGLLDGLTELPAHERGKGFVRLFLTQWEKLGAERFSAVVRAAIADAEVVVRIRDLIVAGVVTPVVAAVAPDRVELRAQLVASQLIGLGMARWVARMNEVAAADIEVLVQAVGPTIQRYLMGDLD